MRVVFISRFGGPEVLQVGERPTPAPAAGEVLVRVRATAVNRADLLQRLGRYPAPADASADVPGLEFAGEVEKVGSGVAEFMPGDRVFGLVGGGAYADHLVTHARALVTMPADTSFVEAAAIPEAFMTAFDAMVTQGGLGAGETVLVSAVGSGVGTAAVQIARALGARALGTSRTPEKLGQAAALGLTEGIPCPSGRFADEVNRRTGGRGVDVVLELVGGPYVPEDLECIAVQGRILVVGSLAGARADLDLAAIMRKRVSIRGTVLRSRPLEEKLAVTQAFRHHLLPLFQAGVLHAVVDRTFSLSDAARAHDYVAAGGGFGKVVLECGA